VANFTPRLFTPEKDPVTHSLGGPVVSKAGLDVLKKTKSLSLREFEPLTVQPVALVTVSTALILPLSWFNMKKNFTAV
jgi:hypothetical protein